MECKCQTCYFPLQGRALGFASRSADNLDSRQAGSVSVLPHALPGKTPLDSCSAVFFLAVKSGILQLLLHFGSHCNTFVLRRLHAIIRPTYCFLLTDLLVQVLQVKRQSS